MKVKEGQASKSHLGKVGALDFNHRARSVNKRLKEGCRTYTIITYPFLLLMDAKDDSLRLTVAADVLVRLRTDHTLLWLTVSPLKDITCGRSAVLH